MFKSKIIKFYFNFFFFLFFFSSLVGVEKKSNAKLFDEIHHKLIKNYYNIERLKPNLIIDTFSSAIQFEFPEISILLNIDQKKASVSIENGQAVEVSWTSEDHCWRVCSKIYSQVHLMAYMQNQKSRLEEVLFKAITKSLKTLDPHTRIYSPKDARKFSLRTSQKNAGLGLSFYRPTQESEITVLTVVPGKPADLCGIEEGDIIRKINDMPTLGITDVEVLKKIRESGESVHLLVEKKGGLLRPYFIEKEWIPSQTVSASFINGEIAYFKINKFGIGTFGEFLEFYQKMEQGEYPESYKDLASGAWKSEGSSKVKKEIQSVVLDLRGNPGGVMKEAKDFCDFFLKKGLPIVGERNATKKKSQFISEWPGNTLVPLIVLINHRSASASEIVAGCLQANNRALIIGEPSYGKGSVQQVEYLNYGSQLKTGDPAIIKTTTSEYFVANGQRIQNVGVYPAIQMMECKVGKDQISFSPDNYKREKDHDSSIGENKLKVVDKAKAKVKNIYFLGNESYTEDQKRRNKSLKRKQFLKNELSFHQDERMEFVVRMLSGVFVNDEEWNPKSFIQQKRLFLNNEKKENQRKIGRALKEVGVVWHWGLKPLSDADLKPKVETVNLPKTYIKKAGETFDLTIELKNNTNVPIYNMMGRLEGGGNTLFDSIEIYWGEIEAGGRKKAVVRKEIPIYEIAQTNEMLLKIFDQNKELLLENSIELVLEQSDLPKIVFSYQIQEKELNDQVKADLEKDKDSDELLNPSIHEGEIKSNSNGILEAGETFLLSIKVQNESKIVSHKNQFSIRFTNPLFQKWGAKIYPLSKRNISLNENESKTIDYYITLPETESLKKIKYEEIDFNFSIYDFDYEYVFSSQIKVDVNHRLKDDQNNTWSNVYREADCYLKGLPDRGSFFVQKRNINLEGLVSNFGKINKVYSLLNGRKNFFQRYKNDQKEGEFKINCDLKKGLNFLDIYLTNSLGAISKKTYTIFCTPKKTYTASD